MEKTEVYKFIGKLAIAVYPHEIQISLKSLRAILSERGVTYESGRAMASGVSAAYSYWEDNGETVIHHAIAHTFVDEDGQLAWKDT